MHRMLTSASQSYLETHYRATKDSRLRTLMVGFQEVAHHSWGSLVHHLQLQSDSEISRIVAYLTAIIMA